MQFCKNKLFRLYSMNQWLDIDDTYKHYWYQQEVKIDLRSRSQGQRSTSYMQLYEKTVWAINQERMILYSSILKQVFIFMQKWSWLKVKVTRSKVKVNHTRLLKKLIWLYAMNQWLDMDDTCTYDWYQWDVKVDLRSRSQVQRSRSNMQFCIKTCFAYIPWTNDCTLMMHIQMISIVEMLTLTKGQGHKVKVKHTIL